MLIEALAVVFTALLVYWQLAAGILPRGADHTLMYSPFFAQRWDFSAGWNSAPLWATYQLSGAPLVDNLQAALLYPLRWPFYFIHDWRSYYGLFYWLHYALAMAGMACLLRAWGVRGGALLAGVVVAIAGGHYQGRILNPTIFMACCWLPWLLYGASGWGRRHGWATLAATAMICMIGSPHLMFYGALGYGLVVVLMLWPAPLGGVPSRAKGLAKKAGAAAVGVLLASPTLLPGILRAHESVRTQTRIAEHSLANSLEWGKLPLSLLGGTGGLLYPEYIDGSVYVGAPLVLMLLCFLLRRSVWRDRRVRAAVGLVVVSYIFALGNNVGLQYIQPYIPGFNLLEGPLRALCLAAVGLGLLASLWLEYGLPRRGWFLPVLAGLIGLALLGWFVRVSDRLIPAEGSPPYLDEWLRAWAWGPGAVVGIGFAVLDSALTLLGLALLLGVLAWCRIPGRFGAWVIATLLLGQLLHFAPRVAPPMARSGYFDPPRSVNFLREAGQLERQPFRIAGFDALRYTDVQLDEPHAFDVLMPNLAGLYGLEDIQGFEPLIRRDYAALFDRTSGRPPFNDPIRNLDLGRPDPLLFKLLNVRYLIGHPLDRRVTNLPLDLSEKAPEGVPPNWRAESLEGPVAQWRFVSFFSAPLGLPLGATVATLEVEAAEGTFKFPVRHGLETGYLLAACFPDLASKYVVRPFLEWTSQQAAPSLGYQWRHCNYVGLIDFGRPLTVRHIRWRLSAEQGFFRVLSQAARLAWGPEQAAQWRRISGEDDDLDVIYEYVPATARAVLIDPLKAGTSSTPGAVNVDDAALCTSQTAGSVSWLRRGNHSLELEVQASQPALLVLREMATQGWEAKLNGQPAPLLTVNRLFRGLQVPMGSTRVELTYAPRLVRNLGVFALVLVAGCLGLLGWQAWRWGTSHRGTGMANGIGAKSGGVI